MFRSGWHFTCRDGEIPWFIKKPVKITHEISQVQGWYGSLHNQSFLSDLWWKCCIPIKKEDSMSSIFLGSKASKLKALLGKSKNITNSFDLINLLFTYWMTGWFEILWKQMTNCEMLAEEEYNWGNKRYCESTYGLIILLAQHYI